jgi:hypothetical protein
VKGSGKRRAVERAECLIEVQEIDARALLKLQFILASYLIQESDCVLIAGHEKVLAVIDYVARCGIYERIGAPAEMAAPFQHSYLVTPVSQLDRRGEAGKSAPDYDNLFAHPCLLSVRTGAPGE